MSDYYELLEVSRSATPDELKKDKETFRAQLLNERRNLFYSAYMTKAKEKMNIQINNDVVTRVSSQLGV